MSKITNETTPKIDPQLELHLQQLGLKSISEYKEWCTRNGFSKKLHKSFRQRRREIMHQQRERAIEQMNLRRRVDRTPAEAIERAFRNKGQSRHPDQIINTALKFAFEACQCQRERRVLKKLFLELHDKVNFLYYTEDSTRRAIWRDNPYLMCLVRLARYERNWIRPIGSLKLWGKDIAQHFLTLINHLFMTWPIPKFMYQVWFIDDYLNELPRKWFVYLSRGRNIFHAQIAPHYTRKMVAHFLDAPQKSSIKQAMLWGRVRGLGGSEALAKAISSSDIIDNHRNIEFWSNVIKWLIRYESEVVLRVNSIIEYIYDQKFYRRYEYIDGNWTHIDPPAPNLTMKDRKPAAIFRQIEEWHFQACRNCTNPVWNKSGIDDFAYKEELDENNLFRQWRVRELVTIVELLQEASQMRNCVASYANDCSTYGSSIWSLTSEQESSCKNELTIQVVNENREIVQAKAFSNQRPSKRQRSILRKWAEQANLKISRYV
ncbi:MAG: PcfJ domain-containing protein [Planctomycetaceae bacterium]